MSKIQTPVFEWQIKDRIKETPDSYTFVFSPFSASNRFTFNVGEFVTIRVSLKRPTSSGGVEEAQVERAYSIASSPTRDDIELTIKDEKPYGYINPIIGKADGFAAYFFEQFKVGDKVSFKYAKAKEPFLARIATGAEKDIAYWSGSNGAECARCLLQYMEDRRDLDLQLVLFYSNPRLYSLQKKNSVGVIYYDWLLDMAKKLENFKVVFTFTKDNETDLYSDHPRITYRKGRFFKDEEGRVERTLQKFHGNVESAFNPICGSSGFINGIVKLKTGSITRGRGIMHDLMEIEGVKPEKIDKEQFYLDVLG
jgi:ferredoxin-NADP reductase